MRKEKTIKYRRSRSNHKREHKNHKKILIEWKTTRGKNYKLQNGLQDIPMNTERISRKRRNDEENKNRHRKNDMEQKK